jgi:methionyl-tRNA formyltransferase
MEDDSMAINKPGIVFMGTPEFAVASLEAIVNAGYTVKGVITSPDKPSGRGLQLHPSPVKEFALKHDLPVLQPLKLKDPEFLKDLQNLKADLQVIVAFRMLPEEVWQMPRLGTFNLHASLLPHYRGAAPINWAVINGETKTGITTFFINHEIDKGLVIFTEETIIGDNETAGDVHNRLMVLGAQLVIKTIASIAGGTARTIDQHHLIVSEPLKPAPKIFKNDCKISWNNNIKKLHDLIRGLSPYPTAWSELITCNGEILIVKIYSGTPVKKQPQQRPGTIETDEKSFLRVAALDGFINIESIQLQGKKQMAVAEFLRGFPQIKECRFQE